MSALRPLAIAAVALAPLLAHAQSGSTETTLLAFSRDGHSALLSVRTRAPDGGEALAYRLVSGKDGSTSTFLANNTFDAGGGSLEDRVTREACEEAIEQLDVAVHAAGIEDVMASAGGCRKPEAKREPVLLIEDRPPMGLARGQKLQVTERAVRLRQGTKTLKTLARPEGPTPTRVIPYRSPGGRLLVLLAEVEPGHVRLWAAYASPTGNPRNLVPVPIETAVAAEGTPAAQ